MPGGEEAIDEVPSCQPLKATAAQQREKKGCRHHRQTVKWRAPSSPDGTVAGESWAVPAREGWKLGASVTLGVKTRERNQGS